MKKASNGIDNINFDYAPVCLKKTRGHTINSRSFVRKHRKNGLFDLQLVHRFNQLSVHEIGNSARYAL